MKLLDRIRDVFYIFVDYFFMIVVFVALAFLVYVSYNNLLEIEVRPQETETVEASTTIDEPKLQVVIPAGASKEQLADVLISYGVLKAEDKADFLTYFDANWSESEVPFGEHEMQVEMSFEDILKILRPAH